MGPRGAGMTARLGIRPPDAEYQWVVYGGRIPYEFVSLHSAISWADNAAKRGLHSYVNRRNSWLVTYFGQAELAR